MAFANHAGRSLYKFVNVRPFRMTAAVFIDGKYPIGKPRRCFGFGANEVCRIRRYRPDNILQRSQVEPSARPDGTGRCVRDFLMDGEAWARLLVTAKWAEIRRSNVMECRGARRRDIGNFRRPVGANSGNGLTRQWWSRIY